MPVFNNKTNNEKILFNLTMLNNALNSKEIMSVLTGANYPAEKLKGYLAQHEELKTLMQQQKSEYSEQHEAARLFEAAAATVDEKYMYNLKFARVIFKNNPKAQEELLLNGRRSRAFSSWYSAAETFYNTVISNPVYQKELDSYGITTAALTKEFQALQELLELNRRYLKEKGEAVESTHRRDQLLDQLDDAMTDLIKICKLLFAKQPDTLKQLGIVI